MSKSADFYFTDFVLSKINYLERRGHKFSHISEMNITFIADWKRMTYEYYLSLPKSMLEWKLNTILHKNPQLVTLFDESTHPLITKYARIYYDFDG